MTIVLAVVVYAHLGGFVWRKLFIRPKFDKVIGEQVQIVGELYNYYHQEVRFALINTSQVNDTFKLVELDVFNSPCDSLTTTIKVMPDKKSKFSIIAENCNLNHLPKTPNTEINGSNGVKGCTLGMAVNASIIDMDITHEQAVRYIIEDRDCTISLKFRTGKTCLVAHANIEISSYPSLCLEAQVIKMQTLKVLVTTVVPSTAVTLTILVCTVFTGCCCRRTRLCKRQEYSTLVNEEALSEYAYASQ